MANRLKAEQSQYLLQHAHNPVDWFPWGDEAFEKARLENKPVIVSIGYAACHWCHVMERESFEDDKVASYMNENFVCIKVDREENPDVDHMYMDAVQAISGSGGWPLNAFVTPDRVPFYGGTYYPPRPAYNRPSWMQVMQRMMQIWVSQQDEVIAQAEQMVNYLRQSAIAVASTDKKDWNRDTCHKIATALLRMADKEMGGFGNAPKFPGTMAISFLLDNYHFTGNDEAMQQALLSLDVMANGGIYDQLGGGFARYSTDRQWLAPHFEKMLYDNALLIMAYCDAYSLTKFEGYKETIDETIAFMDRELRAPEGGYYCALDADSEGVEGKFYTWTWDEWMLALGEDALLAGDYFGVNEEGNWEHTNILHIADDPEAIAIKYGCSLEELNTKINAVKARLLDLRSAKPRPLTDDKCLLSWNALASIALVKAGVLLENPDYLLRATTHMQWMLKAFGSTPGMKHTFNKGIAKIEAKLDDFAYLVQALLRLGSASGDNIWISKAVEITEWIIRDFEYDSTFFYFTSIAQQDIPVRKVDVHDGATPSANAVMAENLWICGMASDRVGWISRAERMLVSMASQVLRNPYSFGYWARLIQQNIVGMKVIVAAGENAIKRAAGLKQHFAPHSFLVFCSENAPELTILKNKFSPDNLYIFVCSESACLSPVSSVGQAIATIDDFN